MSTVVIGGHGYVGSYLSRHLRADVLDLGWYGTNATYPGGAHHYDTVIDLAAYSALRNCDLNPEGAWETNVMRLRNLMEILQPGQTLIYASSASVYKATERPSREDDPVHPVRTYDMTKCVDDMLAQLAIAQGKTVIGLRFGTMAGLAPHTRTDLVVNSMTWDAITTGQVRVANADSLRTLLFLPDMAEAITRVIADPQPGIYNLGSRHVTIGQIAEYVAEATGAEIVRMDDENPYSFRVDSTKFLTTYGNYRTTTLPEVIAELATGLPNVHRSRRDILP